MQSISQIIQTSDGLINQEYDEVKKGFEEKYKTLTSLFEKIYQPLYLKAAEKSKPVQNLDYKNYSIILTIHHEFDVIESKNLSFFDMFRTIVALTELAKGIYKEINLAYVQGEHQFLFY